MRTALVSSFRTTVLRALLPIAINRGPEDSRLSPLVWVPAILSQLSAGKRRLLGDTTKALQPVESKSVAISRHELAFAVQAGLEQKVTKVTK